MIYKKVYNPDATLDLICIKAYIKYALKNPKATDKIWDNLNKAINIKKEGIRMILNPSN